MGHYLGSRRIFSSPSPGPTGYGRNKLMVILVVKINKPNMMESGLWTMKEVRSSGSTSDDWNHLGQLLLLITGFHGYKLFLISTQLFSVSPGLMSDMIIKVSLHSLRQEDLGFLLAWETCGVFEVSFVVVFSLPASPGPPWSSEGHLPAGQTEVTSQGQPCEIWRDWFPW